VRKIRKQTIAVITTLALLVYFTVIIFPVVANGMVVDVFPFSGFNKIHSNNVWSTTIFLNQTVDIYAQVSYVQSGGVPPSTFVWYVNGTAVKSDVIGSSTLTFAPPTLGVYDVNVTVNGETNSELVIVTVIGEATPYTTQTIHLTPTPSPSVPELSWLAILPLLVVITFIASKFNRKNFLKAYN